MNLSHWTTAAFLLLAFSAADASQEWNLEIATESTCKQLLYDATTLYGSITDIEYALNFALEAQNSISENRKVSGRTPESTTELHEINLKISRIIAMRHLFQEPECPIKGDWYTYQPSNPN